MLNELAKQIYEDNKAKGFWDDRKNIGEMLMLVTSELAEALEAHRNGNYNYTQEFTTKPDDFEEWMEIEGFQGEYEVSNLGRVRSLDMIVRDKEKYYSKKGRLLSPGLGGTGYYTVSLKGKTQKVSRLVAAAFCKGNSKGLYVNHINGIKTDDYSNNLEYLSPGENNNHAIKSGLKSMFKILTKKQMIDIAFLAKNGVLYSEIYKKYPQVSYSRIKEIARQRDKITECFEFEIADAIIRLLDLSGGLGIDIEFHIKHKLAYNKTRPFKHGKKY